MKTDKELLELAAKAVSFDFCDGLVRYERGDMFGGEPAIAIWDPLEDDGDAFRLAVSLEMLINPESSSVNVCSACNGFADVVEQFTNDKAASTRRAIVIAAAIIGENL